MPARIAAAAIGLAASLGPVLGASKVGAADAANQPVYVVTYFEVAPTAIGAARGLIAARCADAHKAPGLMEIGALQRHGQSNHFAFLEAWRTAKAREDFAATTAAKDFAARLAPDLIAGYDERLHTPLTVGASEPALSGLVTLTHVDLIPPFKDAGIAEVKAFAERTRGANGNLRFDVLTQAGRDNHMTVVQDWPDAAAWEAHIAAGPTRAFRQSLLPMSGSPYDEREYDPLRC
jgi:quinol monooxygenase YgiN